MKKDGIFLDKYGYTRGFWIFVGYFIFMMLIMLAYILSGTGGNSEELNDRANYKAFCDSIGGSFGGTECYKDGMVITKDQILKIEDKK